MFPVAFLFYKILYVNLTVWFLLKSTLAVGGGLIREAMTSVLVNSGLQNNSFWSQLVWINGLQMYLHVNLSFDTIYQITSL